MRRAPLHAWTALVGLLLSGAVALVPAAPAAAAQEVAERPADGVFTVEGRGWGHGRGMSQWGAQGAASLGLDAETIVGTYYPGTERAVLPAAPIRVLLSGDEGRDTVVHAATGLTVTDAATGATEVLPAGPGLWRVVVDAAGLHLQSLHGTTWSPYALGGATTHTGPVRFTGPELVRLAFPSGASRDYRGAVQAVRVSSTALQSVVVLPLEDYLLGVVPRESSASWRPAALQAQAIAARSYSANKRARVAGKGTYDICDTTACQVFGGSALYSASGRRTPLEPATTTAAVRATEGVVRTYGGAPVFAEYSSSNGGWSTRGDFPYLRPARDDWDGAVTNAVHAWRASLRATDLERRFPAVGTLQRIRVTARDGNGEWDGRVTSVVLEGVSSTGAATSVRTSGAGVYGARSWPASSDGLRSSWWRIVGAAPTTDAPPADGPPAGTPTASAPPSPPTPAQTGTPPATPVPTTPTPSTPAPEARLTAAVSGPVVAVTPGGVLTDGRTVVVPRWGSTEVRLAYTATGDVAWPVGPGSPVQLGTSSARNRGSASAGPGWSSWVRPGLGLEAAGKAEVAPGGTGSFGLRLHGNGRPAGTTVEHFEPLWAGRGWLEGAERSLVVVRVDPAVPRAAHLHSRSPAAVTLSTGATGRTTLVVRMRNVGGHAWTVGSERLGTLGGTAFPLAAGWTSPSRPPALAANAVRPGVRTVEPGEVGEWRVPVSAVRARPGRYVLQLAPAAPTGRFGPTVATTVTVVAGR